MRTLITLILFVSFHLVSYNQVTITGTIFDKDTKDKIGFATAYFDGSFVGTSSDTNGEFRLNVPYNTDMPLIVSAIGYFSVTLPDFSIDKPLIIYLEPKEYQIEEVIVSGKSLVKKKKANLKVFRAVFLGTTENALNCKILNAQDISFNYGTDRDTLKAIVSKPILIKNSALGYNASYYLNKFEYYRKSNSFLIEGNMIFNEDLASEAADEQIFEERRKSAYLGSRMHFFRALWANDLSSAGFLVKNSSGEDLNFHDIVIEGTPNLLNPRRPNTKYLKYPTKLLVSYHSSSSELVLPRTRIYFDEFGFFDSNIFWDGEMVTKRIGDKLPYEYKIRE